MTDIRTIKNELRKTFGNTITTGDLVAYSPKYMRIMRQHGTLAARGVWDLTDDGSAVVAGTVIDAPVAMVPTMTREELATHIRKRFNVLTTLANGITAGNVRALIISGAAGVGKTFELEKKLTAARRDGDIDTYETIKGSISAVVLYEMLYNNREEGQVLLLDDTDSVFADDECLNLLKAALDTSKVRKISWAKASRYLADSDIPQSFEYEGQIVFITNTNPDAVIAKGGRLAPHMSALLSRSVFLDLGIHDSASIMIRVEQVLSESNLAEELKLTKGETKAIIEWMNSNITKLRSVSIRTVIQLAGFIKTSDEWQDLAEVTLFKAGRF